MTSDLDEPPRTGHADVDTALAALDLDAPLAEHAAQLQSMHAVLQSVLNPPAQPGPQQG